MDFSGRGMEGDLFDMLNGGGMGGFMSGGGGLGGGLLGQMFGGGSRRRKGETTVQPFSVSLEDLYNGKNSKLQLTKKALCKTCNGVGGKPGSVKRCEYCRGSGRVFTTRQIGPGMLQQIASQCDHCSGGGENIDDANRCKTCNGRKTVQEQKIIEVKVEPGMRDNQKIVFYGEGDQEPGIEPGDVVLVIKTKPHDIFDRKNDDLFIKKNVTLKQALCGFTSTIKHLNGKDIVVNTLGEEIIKPESVRVAFGKGMPKHGKPGELGNLYFIFNVTFPPPHFLENEQRYKDLEALLPPRQRFTTKFPANLDVEEVTLSDFDSHRYERSGGGGGAREAYHDDESDDEMPSGAQHVQCAQQ